MRWVGSGPEVQGLIGGFKKSFRLKPLALGEAEGIDASLGMGYLYLQKDPLNLGLLFDA